jgi:hypothetical protein
MKINHSKISFPMDSVPRSLLITLLRTGLSVKEIRFTREVALKWLAVFPGDLEVRLLYAQSINQVRGPEQAFPLLEELTNIDPQWYEAQIIRHQYLENLGNVADSDVSACVLALGGRIKQTSSIPKWGFLLLKSRQALQELRLDQAEIFVQRALLADPSTPLAAVTHLEVINSMGQATPRATRSLAEHYASRWPNCLIFQLFLADAMMEGGESEEAVALLHKVAAADIAGQVVKRIWGPDHPYQSLWPVDLSSRLEIPIPASVGSALGWNQLPQGEENHLAADSQSESSTVETSPKGEAPTEPTLDSEKTPIFSSDVEEEISKEIQKGAEHPSLSPHETLISVQTELEKVAAKLKKTHLLDTDGRFPVYVILTTRQGLERQYGPEGTLRIDQKLKELVSTIQKKEDWDATLVYADDPSSTAPFGIKPAPANDPWQLKLVVKDLDDALKKQGELIGALLIAGGPEVIPFHNLPNPVDDEDPEVPSDNPYGTRDDNYFIPEWPIGRIPGDASNDPDPLLGSIEEVIERHLADLEETPWYRRVIDWILTRVLVRHRTVHPSFGYTAAAWRKASMSVFRPIGEPRSLLASPPTVADHLTWNGLIPAQLGYYNLHGLIDSTEWYGQRDPGQNFDGPDYPVALRPKDVVNSGRSPNLVFTEACFGAHIVGKRVDQAMALKFLNSGTQAVLGSTCTAYGSIATPLIAADLLGHTFWRYVREGYLVGEAVRQAKIFLAQEMHQRQGYLDGEDQKTLISFVLYGDPLSQPFKGKRVQKSIFRAKEPNLEIKTVCDRAPDDWTADIAPTNVVDHVKRVVEQYLPGMSDAKFIYSREHRTCDGTSHDCPTSQMNIKSNSGESPSRRVVTLSKQVQTDGHIHPHFARLTLDHQGKVVKLAISR